MKLESGTRLGPYLVEEPIGAGGMGEVYRARDTRLDRTVAIKVLPSHLSEDPDLKARFDREAKTISSLQHPNICALFDVGHEEGTDFLVMEHLEGESLAARLSSGPLTPDEVLRFGRQITAALDAAHRQGVVHRDLKPGNIMLTRSGVKLLDFGLAKTAEGGALSDSSLTSVATLTGRPTGGEPLTQEGSILGTFQYMAPEQLEGREADVRSDIFSLGVVLYEMCTGRKAFHGESHASLIASIMTATPDPISSVTPMAPPALDRVIRSCLEKDPEERLQTVHDVGLQLKWIEEGGSEVAGVPRSIASRRRSRERLAWILAAVAGLVAVALGVLEMRRPEPPAPETMRFEIRAPRGVADFGSPRISPDGRHIAFDGTDTTGTTSLWVRSLDAIQARRLEGTEGCGRPIWSDDSRHIAFFVDDKLKRIPLEGGPTLTLCAFPNGSDGTWAGDTILFDGSTGDSINAVPAGGGTPTGATNLDRASGANSDGWPFFLPDGQHFLYIVYFDNAPSEIHVARLGSFDTRFLTQGDSRVEYVEPGYLVYEKGGTLLAQPFDADKAEITGDAFPLTEGIGTGVFGLAHFSGSRTGTLIHASSQSNEFALTWFDRRGDEIEQIPGTADYNDPTLSPDGRRLAVELSRDGEAGTDLWILDLVRGTRSRFTFDNEMNCCPVWSPDGKSVYFSSRTTTTGWGVRIRDAGGARRAETVFAPGPPFVLSDITPDGKTLLAYAGTGITGMDLVDRPVDDPESETRVLADLPGFTGDGRISPDGRYVIFTSAESGQDEVFLATYPDLEGRWQISVGGGNEPAFRGDGRELYYLSLDDRLMAVDLDTANGNVQIGLPHALFRPRYANVRMRNRYLPTPDGERFLFVSFQSDVQIPPLTVVLDWAADLRNR